jgi:hypothetical protein
MSKRVLKTRTLGHDDDNPTVSICPGHVTTTEFNHAHRAEGWAGFDWIRKDDLKHTYYVRFKSGAYKEVPKGTKGSKPFTAMAW